MTSKEDYRSFEEYQNRLRKLQKLRSYAVEPYPHAFSPTHTAHDLHRQYADAQVGTSQDAEEGKTPLVTVAGRMMLFRPMGKNAFLHIQDASGRIQVMCNREKTALSGLNSSAEEGLTPLKVLEKECDLGDIIGVEGHLFRTQKGELTVFARQVTLLCKSLLPLPDKHSGLVDKETRYRKRWLDLIAHESVQQTFRERGRIIRLIRTHLEELGFLEVETPVLQNIYGGAQARPFTSHLNALDQEMYLRISLEIPLKKLVVGGIDRVFEIGKVFRNEGIDRTHNPEFTMLEVYAAYWDYTDMMRLTETLYERIAVTLFGTPQVTATDPETQAITIIELKAPWKRMTMRESIHAYAGLDVDALDDDTMRHILISEEEMKPAEVQGCSRGLLIAHLFETKVAHQLIQPHHITDHPIETTPLCKPHRDPRARALGIIERFESFILGNEICNAYSELNDPELQRTLLEAQAERLAQGDQEANPLDEEFLEAICQGMPPTAGLGIGIDRLVMLFTDTSSIRDVLPFPLMRGLDSILPQNAPDKTS